MIIKIPKDGTIREEIDKSTYIDVVTNRKEEMYIEKAKLKFGKDIYSLYSYHSSCTEFQFFVEYSFHMKTKIPAGVYRSVIEPNGTRYLDSISIGTEKSLELDTRIQDILKNADFKKQNNILAYGNPGNGKTQSILNCFKSLDNYTFIICNHASQIDTLRYISTEGPLVVVLEEFTEVVESNPSVILNYLDGIMSIPNSITIMTTNYPEKLEENIIDRPSRVRHFLEYKNPDKNQIDIIAKHFNCDASFFYNKDYTVDNIMNIIKEAEEMAITLEEAERYIQDKRKFLSGTFKSNRGKMGL